jgi:hypothetical protein
MHVARPAEERQLLLHFYSKNILYYFMQSMMTPGANPTIASYNASVVNFYKATGSLARFESKNIIFYF